MEGNVPAAPKLKAWVLATSGRLTWADVEGYGKVTAAQAQAYADYYQQRSEKVLSESAYQGYVALSDFWADIAFAIRKDQSERR